MKSFLTDSSLSDSIIRFQALCKKHRADNECRDLEKHLTNEVLIISYFLPQTEFGMKEEDASDFILYLKPYVEDILLSFQGGDFSIYIRKTLKNRLSSFYRMKTRENRNLSIAEIEGGIDMLYESEHRYGTEIESRVLSDNNSAPVMLLRAVFARSKIARKRFFIFLSSLCPFISEPDLALICKDLSINFREASGIRKYLIAISDADKTMADIKETEERRNSNFAFAIINEIKAELKQKEGLKEEAQEYMEKAERRKELVRKSLLGNRKMSLGLGPKLLSSVFDETQGTVANDICLTKRLLSWCLSPSSYSPEIMLDLRINQSFVALANNPEKKTKLTTFSPYKEFELCKGYYAFKDNRFKLPSVKKSKEL